MGSLVSGIIGGIGSIFGGNSTKKVANQAFDYAKSSPLTNYLSTGANANSMLAGALGVGGDPTGANTGLNNYLNSAGYNFTLDQGSKAITGNAAARGLLGSGATAKALTSYGQGLGQQYFNNYLAQLAGLSSQGLNAGNSIVGAGSAAAPNAAKAEEGKWQGITSGASQIAGFFI